MPPQLPTALRVIAVPAFQDNYLWIVHDGVHAAVIDPGAAEPVMAALASNHLTLTAILLTHHHADHIGGVPALLAQWPVPVFGPRNDGIAAVTVPLGEGEQVEVPGLNWTVSVLDVPGHTRGHIAYVSERAGAHWLFCGDTLFGAGCGRLFEGTPAQMSASLDKLAALPDNTEVYCAHEYTLANLRFAQAVEPDNEAIAARMAHDGALRSRQQRTIPSTIASEKATNPFLRYRAAPIAEKLIALNKLAPGADAVAAFAALREWKNSF
ncbi:hydroxyacylglutathione hydrolase [Massilia sp. CF038]|uniref:hydroxyacylglutathione hydrolase n=1 Tax=Massilia sp. CF038 TaxID=1881045 RepID=UPI000921A015|nr:hydroxyacylglutathione hydrolase [Massilia sp. CF038]SHG95640.1 hydroxyacylglutathione hydrolase [Massilia sp. CF038]